MVCEPYKLFRSIALILGTFREKKKHLTNNVSTIENKATYPDKSLYINNKFVIEHIARCLQMKRVIKRTLAI